MRSKEQSELIARIAEETGAPLEVVTQIYAEALRELSADARIHDYVHLFVVKRVRTTLRDRYPG